MNNTPICKHTHTHACIKSYTSTSIYTISIYTSIYANSRKYENTENYLGLTGTPGRLQLFCLLCFVYYARTSACAVYCDFKYTYYLFLLLEMCNYMNYVRIH